MDRFLNKNLPSLLAGALIFVVSIYLFGLHGYAGSYGKQLADGTVDLSARATLWQTMRADYGKDGGEWSFGYFVPLAVVGLFWVRRKDLLATPVKPVLWLGGVLLFLGFFIYFGGYKANQKYFGYMSGQLLVLGLIFWYLGWEWFKKLFWLWALLGMFWPWRFLIEPISTPLQHVMVYLTSGALELFGVQATKSGTAVLTDTVDPVTGEFISLNVAAACSGLRSLFALVMIGLVFAFMRVKEEWKRWVLMACVPAVAVAGNFVRMMMLYLGSRWWGTEFAIGEGNETNASTYHMVAGLVVFAVAVVLMSALSEIMNRGGKFFKRAKVTTRRVQA
ncbi:MAG: exosortase/archaeosortase family protein [Verrucomicrobiales bacterium]